MSLRKLVPCGLGFVLVMLSRFIVFVLLSDNELSFCLSNGFRGDDGQKTFGEERSRSVLQTADAPKISRFHSY